MMTMTMTDQQKNELLQMKKKPKKKEPSLWLMSECDDVDCQKHQIPHHCHRKRARVPRRLPAFFFSLRAWKRMKMIETWTSRKKRKKEKAKLSKERKTEKQTDKEREIIIFSKRG